MAPFDLSSFLGSASSSTNNLNLSSLLAIANTAPSFSHLGAIANDSASSADIALGKVVKAAYESLVQFAQEESFAEQMTLIFGQPQSFTNGTEFFQALAQTALSESETGIFPNLELVDGDSLNQAYGVYAEAIDTIYLSRQFLSEGDSEQHLKVLLEEIGHSLDARLNAEDSLGDEGDLFAHAVLGEVLSEATIAQIRQENDSTVLTINGQILPVEMNGTPPSVGLAAGASISESVFKGQVYQTARGADNLIYSRYSSDRVTWSAWQESGGGTLDNPTTAVFNNQLYQVVRGGDNGIYQRFSDDGQTWSGWQQFGGGTLDAPEIGVFNNQLYQLVRGGDNGIYQRFSSNGQNWSGWQQFGGGTLESPDLAVFDNKIYHTVRGGDSGIHQRFSSDGQNWSSWQAFGGGTLNSPEVGSFNNHIYQAVRGGNNSVFVRYSSDSQTWTGWQELTGVAATGSPQLTPADDFLTVTVLGDDGQLHSRYSTDGIVWSEWDASPPFETVTEQPEPDANSFNIEFDYRFDTQGWFTPERKAALEAAAEVWEGIIQDDFETVPAGKRTPNVTNPQTGEFTGTARTGFTEFVTDRDIDDLLIFVGARSMGGNTLGVGGASGYFLSEERYNGNDFEPWLGSISFNSDADWFFDATPETRDDIPNSQSDFISSAIHEMGHVLGFSSSLTAFQNNLDSSNNFNGTSTRQRNGGNAIPLIGSHVQDNYEFGGSGEMVMDPSSLNGERQLPTFLDIAMLDDLGYDVDFSKATANNSGSGSGITTNTGQNDTIAPSNAEHDSLLPEHCHCASCHSAPTGINLLGASNLASLVLA